MPEDPNACPIELLKKSGKKNRENLKTKRAGPKKNPQPKSRRKGKVPNKSATETNFTSVSVKPPYNQEHYEELIEMCQRGATLEDCADWFNISLNKLNDHCKRFYGYTFGEIYKQNKAKLKRSVRQALYSKAIDEKYWPAIRYLANNFTEMRDNPEPEVSAESNIIFESVVGDSGEVIREIKKGDAVKSVETLDVSKILIDNKTIDVEEVKDDAEQGEIQIQEDS